MNTFGKAFSFTSFGESHGEGIGCVIDGVPAGLKIDESYIQKELDRRKPGLNVYSTPRKEEDKVKILSGVFEGLSTGTPIALFIANTNQKSKDYGELKELFRPGHGDFTYFKKYGLRDHRGGGRSSARETVARVAAGAIAKKLLSEFGIKVQSGVSGVGELKSELIDFQYAQKSEIYALDASCEEAWKQLICDARSEHNSIGSEVRLRASGMIAGLGEPLYDKLDALIGGAMMGLNGVKAVEIGEGVRASRLKGSQNNDQMDKNGFLSNHSGGILAGISTGQDVEVKLHFKPTPSIFSKQKTIDAKGESKEFELRGRHDPCIGIRGSVVAEMMLALILADLLFLNTNSNLGKIKKCYFDID